MAPRAAYSQAGFSLCFRPLPQNARAKWGWASGRGRGRKGAAPPTLCYEPRRAPIPFPPDGAALWHPVLREGPPSQRASSSPSSPLCSGGEDMGLDPEPETPSPVPVGKIRAPLSAGASKTPAPGGRGQAGCPPLSPTPDPQGGWTLIATGTRKAPESPRRGCPGTREERRAPRQHSPASPGPTRRQDGARNQPAGMPGASPPQPRRDGRSNPTMLTAPG